MNICHDHKFILWAPPRTAARFVHTALRGLGDMPPLTHRIGVPIDGAGYAAVCTVRNPYTRVLSAWKWLNTIREGHYAPTDFKEFVRKHTPIWGLPPISRELGHMLKRVKYLIRTESVEDDLRALPWVPDTYSFPKNKYRSDYCGYAPHALYDEESQERVRRQYCGDFAEFGYDPDVVPETF